MGAEWEGREKGGVVIGRESAERVEVVGFGFVIRIDEQRSAITTFCGLMNR